MKIKKQIVSQHYENRKKEVLLKKNEKSTSMWYEKEEIRNKLYDALIKKDFIIIEVGVRLAENACMIYLRDPKKMYLVDPWIKSSGYPNHSKNDVFYKRVCEVFSSFDNVKIIREKSEIACQKFKKDYFNLAYIDSGHTFKDVLRDLNAWSEKIKIGGYIVGDDYFGEKNPDKRVKWKEHNYGVIEALHAFLDKNKNFEIFHIDEEKTFPFKAGQFIIKRVY
jgi:hypothetical protein